MKMKQVLVNKANSIPPYSQVLCPLCGPKGNPTEEKTLLMTRKKSFVLYMHIYNFASQRKPAVC